MVDSDKGGLGRSSREFVRAQQSCYNKKEPEAYMPRREPK